MASFKAALVLPILLAATAVQADPFKPSRADQVSLGQQAAAQIRKEERILPPSDPRVVEVRRIGDLLVSKLPPIKQGLKPFVYSFDVVVSDELNAFALPGGPIFINAGLLDKLKHEDEIAGILGHELTHIHDEHWASSYANNLKRKLGLTVVLMLLGSNNDLLDAADMLDSILVGLPYMRKHETDADLKGYDTIVAANYNPQGLVNVLQQLMDSAKGKKVEEWLSSHPDTKKRIEAIQKRLAADKQVFRPLTLRKAVEAKVGWDSGWGTLLPKGPGVALGGLAP